MKNHIDVAVGYAWNGDVRQDTRWKAMREALKGVANEAISRWHRKLSGQDEKTSRLTTGLFDFLPTKYPPCR